MVTCHTLAEIRAAAHAEHDGPLTQEEADRVAAILAQVQAQGDAA